MASAEQKQQYTYHWNRLLADPERTLLSALTWAVGIGECKRALALNGNRKATVLALAAALAEIAEGHDGE